LFDEDAPAKPHKIPAVIHMKKEAAHQTATLVVNLEYYAIKSFSPPWLDKKVKYIRGPSTCMHVFFRSINLENAFLSS
jgi:hypothetical protein